MNKKLLFMAVAGVLSLSSASQAAIDDAGMKYVSASEGLSGSIRIKMLADDNRDGVDPRTDFSRSRIVYNGDTDLGGGMAATYFFEFRPRIKEDDENGSNDDEFQVKYIDAGLKGPFGHIRVGEIETVSEAILPNADRSNDNGTSGASLVEDYERGLRWISPNINGLVLGVSAELMDEKEKRNAADDDDIPSEDDAVDTWDIVATYELPMGLAVGGSYAVKTAASDPETDADEDEEGFRLGAEYEQDNWGVAYNYHSYKASIADRDEDDFLVAAYRGAVGHKDTETKEHAIGANVKVNRFNFAFTYATAEVANDNDFIPGDTPTTTGKQALSAEHKKTTVDVGYTLGSKARVIAAYETAEVEGAGAIAKEDKGWYLLYRVDF